MMWLGGELASPQLYNRTLFLIMKLTNKIKKEKMISYSSLKIKLEYTTNIHHSSYLIKYK